ncbi:major facilitator superfamily domain-containing protein [Truncatella angustata]|uniref:Major facilitator superfamily domain-containing protein n=1 Tax=Truncatella angustata TaxID=152316 RepID=A0A9P9A1Q3_9PEZI|nr:major facilitator superfamily domain-containing protein [Truncatella angustata]KAH6657200.1 major facilitator superfamily domain-containing protein [Truncatella angustata]
MESDQVRISAETPVITEKMTIAAYAENSLDDYSSNPIVAEALTPKDHFRQLWVYLKKDNHSVLWSLYVMTLVFGWGYDYDEYIVPDLWQSLWNGVSTIGQVFGAFLVGKFADYTGRKAPLWIAIVVSLSSSFAQVFAPNLPVLFVSKLMLGFSIATRPFSVTNVTIDIGFLLATITGYGVSNIQRAWSYNTAFVLTFLVPGLFATVLPFLPESPVWYMKRGREEDARKTIFQLFGPTIDVEERLVCIRSELEIDAGEVESSSQMSWKAPFTKQHRARTLVAVLGLHSQNFSGGYFANTYQTYYFRLVGQTNSFALTAISSALQLLENTAAVMVSDILPRRKGLVGGGALLCVWFIIIASTSMDLWLGRRTRDRSQATRPKTVAFTLMCQQLTARLPSSVFPYFINPDELDWGGKIMFLFVAAEFVILAILFFVQPETKNRTYQEIGTLYANNIPAREFSQHLVDGEIVRNKVV